LYNASAAIDLDAAAVSIKDIENRVVRGVLEKCLSKVSVQPTPAQFELADWAATVALENIEDALVTIINHGNPCSKAVSTLDVTLESVCVPDQNHSNLYINAVGTLDVTPESACALDQDEQLSD
jgi:hypothetical protein